MLPSRPFTIDVQQCHIKIPNLVSYDHPQATRSAFSRLIQVAANISTDHVFSLNSHKSETFRRLAPVVPAVGTNRKRASGSSLAKPIRVDELGGHDSLPNEVAWRRGP